MNHSCHRSKLELYFCSPTGRQRKSNMHDLAAFLDFAPVAMAVFDDGMRYICATRRWIEDFRLEGPLAGRSHYELFPEIPERWKEIHRRALDGETLCAEEDRFERVNGAVLWLRWEIVPWRRDDGSVGGIVIRSEDITERIGVERQLNETQARLQAVMDAARVGISYADDPNCRHINGNKALWEQFEAGPDSNLSASAPDSGALGRGIRYFISGREVSHSELPLQRAIAEQREIPPMELEVLLPSGKRWHALVSAAPVLDEKNEPSGGVAVTVDITDRRRMEQALREADARKNEFLAVLAHELRNPLAPLRNALSVLDQSEKTPRDAKLFGMMQRQLDHLVRLVDDLMEVSRITRGKIDLEKTAVSLQDVIRMAVETSAPSIEAKRHRLELSLCEDAPTVDGDFVRLVQVFANLLNNAAKFTPEGGRIEIVAKRVAEEAVVHVRDNGCGVRQEMAPRIFEFFTQDASDSKPREGLGVGLALARRLVELHGGEIDVFSAGPGCGSEFTIRLPVREPAAAKDKAARRSTADTLSRRALVVDDNRDVADSLCILLEELGLDVRVVYGGASALAALDSFAPQLAFIDLGMPEMDGYETARRIRQSRSGDDIALFALSGWGREEDRRRSAEAGFNDHLIKPTSIDALKACLHATLSEANRYFPGRSRTS